MNKRGKLIVISGPSGVGKTTICNHILKNRADVHYSISATSRGKRKGEKEGREYIFLSKREFEEWIKRELFVEYAIVHGHSYGTPKKSLEENLEKGYHALLNIDVQGAKKLMQKYPDGIFIFIKPPNLLELARRLVKRNTDDKKDISNRLAVARQELKYKNDYEYVIENRDLEITVKEILSIIEKETETG